MISCISKKLFCIRYTKTHEWVKKLANNTAQVGITYHAREELGEIVYVDLSIANIGEEFQQQSEIASLESVKAAAPVYAPVSMKILQKNEKAMDGLNKDAEKEGWLYEVELTNEEEYKELLNEADYKNLL